MVVLNGKRGFATRSAAQMPRFASLVEARPWQSMALLSGFYLVVVLAMSSLKLLWLDELISLHIAKLHSLQAIWNALSAGADPNPPLSHILVRISTRLLGEHEYAYRLPAALGYWSGLAALFAFLRRRIGASWSLFGVLVSMCMAAFDYSYDARSYGIFYGLSMLAFFFWSRFAEDTRGRASWTYVGLMTAALAAGISTNYFAVLALIPVAGGEAVRAIRARRSLSLADLRVWVGLGIAASTLLIYRALIEHSIAEFSPYAWNRVSWQQVFDSYTQMVEIILYPILALFVVAFCVWGLRRRYALLCSNCRVRMVPAWLARFLGASAGMPLPAHESAGVLLFMLYPVLGYAVARIHGGMLSPRFVIPECFGFAIAAAVAAYTLLSFSARSVSWAVLLVLMWFICREGYVGYWYNEQKECFYKIVNHLPETEAYTPSRGAILIPDPLLALTFQHYAPAQYAARAVFPVDFPAIRRFRGDDSPEHNLWAGRNSIYSLPILPPARIHWKQQPYLIIAGDDNWLPQDLAAHHIATRRLAINTRAGAIGGFTPLARGVPSFYVTMPTDSTDALPFCIAREVPAATRFAPERSCQ